MRTDRLHYFRFLRCNRSAYADIVGPKGKRIEYMAVTMRMIEGCGAIQPIGPHKLHLPIHLFIYLHIYTYIYTYTCILFIIHSYLLPFIHITLTYTQPSILLTLYLLYNQVSSHSRSKTFHIILQSFSYLPLQIPHLFPIPIYHTLTFFSAIIITNLLSNTHYYFSYI